MRYVIGMLLVLAGPAVAGELRDMRENCEAEWPGDRSMQNYCRDEEKRARKGMRDMLRGTALQRQVARMCLDRSRGVVAGVDWRDAHLCTVYTLKRVR